MARSRPLAEAVRILKERTYKDELLGIRVVARDAASMPSHPLTRSRRRRWRNTPDAAESRGHVEGMSDSSQRGPQRPSRWSAYLFLIVVLDVAVFVFAARLLEPSPVYHDNGAIAYPLRVLVSTAVQTGTLPLWDHWTHGGAPLCSLISGLSLSPIVLALSAFGIYDVTRFVAEIVILHLLALWGMFRWLRAFVDADTALLGAACYALSAIVLIQAPINVEAVASQSMFPWYALGLRQSLRGARRGAALIALSLWIMFTTGYLGLDVFAIEMLTLHAVVDHVAVDRRARSGVVWCRATVLVTLGWLLFGGIVNLSLAETYRYFRFDFSRLRQTVFDPFTGSTLPGAGYTFLWPNEISAFFQDRDGGHYNLLYSGAITWLSCLAALTTLRGAHRQHVRRVVVLASFTVVTFLATLSGTWGGRFFTAILPLYSGVRFHCWGLAVVVFFTVTLAALGLRRVRAVEGLGSTGIAAFVGGAVVLLLMQRGGRQAAAALSYPQTYSLLLLAMMMSRRLAWSWPTRVRVLLVVTLCEVAAVSTQLVSLRDHDPGMHGWAPVLALNETLKTSNFPAPPNERIRWGTGNPMYPGNTQYFNKVPSYLGYNPNIHPALRRLQENPRFPELLGRLLYAADESGAPVVDRRLDVSPRQLTPDAFDASVVAYDGPTPTTWSSPFTSSWQLRIDGVAREARENAFGLTTFVVDSGPHLIQFRYRPPWLAASIVLSAVSILIAALLGRATPGRCVPRWAARGHVSQTRIAP